MSHTSIARSSGRLDQFLAHESGIKSRTKAKKLIEEGRVKVNGKLVLKVSATIRGGDKVEYTLFEGASVPSEDHSPLALPILFEDDDCFVIDKPAGVAVHPGSGMKKDEVTILSALRPLFKARSLPYSPTEILVHRLDKDTTGCLLIAKTPEVHLKLQKQFQDRSVAKTYLAIVAGVPKPASAMIDAPIGRHGGARTKMAVHRSVKSRSATTTYRTVKKSKEAALLECDLHTGRTHQIRVHLTAIGHPLLGDETYATKVSKQLSEEYGIRRVCLHAWKLSFESEGKKMNIEAPIPSSLKSTMKLLGL